MEHPWHPYHRERRIFTFIYVHHILIMEREKAPSVIISVNADPETPVSAIEVHEEFINLPGRARFGLFAFVDAIKHFQGHSTGRRHGPIKTTSEYFSQAIICIDDLLEQTQQFKKSADDTEEYIRKKAYSSMFTASLWIVFGVMFVFGMTFAD